MSKKDLTSEQVLELAKQFLAEDIEMIKRAYEYADNAHKGVLRKSGDPYIIHPVQVAGILIGLKIDGAILVDGATVAAGFLHDVVEDTHITKEDIQKEFGEDVAILVDGVTKLKKFKYTAKEEHRAENYQKLFVSMAQDIRVILIKFADRLHNMRTLEYVGVEQQQRVAKETLEILTPLAHRLGMSKMKWEMEDICFRYLNEQQYRRIVTLMRQKKVEREEHLNEAINEVQKQLQEMSITADIYGRSKHIYSIYQKMISQNKQFNEIYDLLALRIIVDDMKECYSALGVIHTCWKPVQGRFKDYIARAKINGYQSIHTTVIGPQGDPMEVQIRTQEMHSIAEFGVAAHWAYKKGTSAQHDKLAWFNQILELEKETNAKEFMEAIQTEDLSYDRIAVFTPKGDMYDLPIGASPIDLAYRIHSELGNKTIGAKINKKIVSLDYELKSNDQVELITSKHSYGPSRDWLSIAKTSHAKNKIRQFFKKQNREENVEKGREAVEKEVRQLGFDFKTIFTNENLKRVAEKFNFSNEEEMYAAVGYNGILPAQVANRLTDKWRKERDLEDKQKKLIEKTKQAPSTGTRGCGIEVKGVTNLLIRPARCCNPVPGDDIIGFITKGRGVSVHRAECVNITEEQKERLIEVQWEAAKEMERDYNVGIEVVSYDRQGILNEVLQAMGEIKTNVVAVNAHTDSREKLTTMNLTISIRNVAHLHKVVERIKRVSDIYSVRRHT